MPEGKMTDERNCERCPNTNNERLYRIEVISLDENNKAKEIFEKVVCYTCRRSLGRWIRNE